MSLADIDNLHYVVESLETRQKEAPLTKVETKLFEEGRPVMEQYTLKKFIDLPVGNRGQIKSFRDYSAYCCSMNDPLDKSPSNLDAADYHAFCTNLALYHPHIYKHPLQQQPSNPAQKTLENQPPYLKLITSTKVSNVMPPYLLL